MMYKGTAREADDASVDSLVQGNTEFALDLYQQLRTRGGNLFFSPYSISTALAMTYAGARGNTARQMAQVLRLRLDQEHLHPAFAVLEAQMAGVQGKGRLQLGVANSLWPDKRFALLKEFLDLAKRHYGVLITALDYGEPEAARQTINAWVEERTENKIEELIPPRVLNPLTALVLANAIYFQGDWASQFEPRFTKEAPFWVTPREQVQVMLMAQTHEFRYGRAGGLQILELPYAGEDLSMVVLLPDELDGLARLEAALTPENLDRWTTYLSKRKIVVLLPRFEVTLPFRLDETLKSMGMEDALGMADFSGMASGRLFIGAVLHKAFVKVNEEGTEAAAATAVRMPLAAPSMLPPTFHADHPFLFLIRENVTGSILFLGRVLDPASGAD